jgi:uncharacterized Zn-binding protein involved in type VI secretion
MPAVSRDRIDLARTGHTCDATAGCSATVGSVFINGRRVLRPGDRLLPHTILVCVGKKCFCVGHPAKINRGSNTVFAEGRPVARRGDSADRGSMMRGSPNVFAG